VPTVQYADCMLGYCTKVQLSLAAARAATLSFEIEIVDCMQCVTYLCIAHYTPSELALTS